MSTRKSIHRSHKQTWSCGFRRHITFLSVRERFLWRSNARLKSLPRRRMWTERQSGSGLWSTHWWRQLCTGGSSHTRTKSICQVTSPKKRLRTSLSSSTLATGPLSSQMGSWRHSKIIATSSPTVALGSLDQPTWLWLNRACRRFVWLWINMNGVTSTTWMKLDCFTECR